MNILALRIWGGGALAAFIDGFIDGCPIGAPAGVGLAAASGNLHPDWDWGHIAIEVGHAVLVPFATGLAEVRSFKKGNPFPNIFAPTGTTQPPFPPTAP